MSSNCSERSWWRFRRGSCFHGGQCNKNTTQAYIGDGSKVNINNEGANVAQEVRVIAADDTVMVDMVGGGAGGLCWCWGFYRCCVLVKTTRRILAAELMWLHKRILMYPVFLRMLLPL